MEKIHTIID